MSTDLYAGDSIFKEIEGSIEGSYLKIGEEDFYKITNYDLMRPFFMTLVSPADHWLFISSSGGLTAGRRNENSALFPYYTDDKLAESFESTGSKTLFRVRLKDKIYIWEPFSIRYKGIYKTSKNLYKNVLGNKIIFEETNVDLGITFRYSWQFSEQYGFIKKGTLINQGSKPVEVEILDGLQNILPYGLTSSLQNERSNLVDAYKKNELELKSGLGLFMLSSIIVDKAEPSEALKATTVWSLGLDPDHYLLSSQQLGRFRTGLSLKTEVDIKAERGAYFINSRVDLKPDSPCEWYIVAELNQDHTSVNNLIPELENYKQPLRKNLEEDIRKGSEKLKQLVGMADGLQLTSDKLICSRHYTNVLFNIMRGGIFDEGYSIDKQDFINYVFTVNRKIANKHSSFLKSLPDVILYQSLLTLTNESGDGDLIRISMEYLPLSFSRRHGDPSRPWNKFSIETKKADGSRNLSYQGNWRDIFQNWEALAISFPGYINSMITKFVNASTIEGYNPYRITREGIDWEVIEPDDPWSYIGYWGDHQIIYLLKLMEVSSHYDLEALLDLLDKPLFVYANVPYLIRPYQDILDNPRDTIDFDHSRESIVEERVEEWGADGKMVFGTDGDLVKANFVEKLLVTLLAKLSNFIPEGGIWLNTQRPEWNDANNALVGNGVSVVTLYYIRRYLTFCSGLFKRSPQDEYTIHQPVLDLFKNISSALDENQHLLTDTISDKDRKSIMDRLGFAGETYRKEAYAAFSGSVKGQLAKKKLLGFLELALQWVDQSIKVNKRNDGLYHSYNLVQYNDQEASIGHLYEMLEGQVAVLSSGVLSSEQVLEVLDALKKSEIYREDQFSYMLYPNRDLPRFLKKNTIPESFISSSALAKSLIETGDRSLLTKDTRGQYHFNGSFNNADDLKRALGHLKEKEFKELVNKECQSYLDVFEEMFNHKAFTGRSGTFFGYEGLGSIYWHMVSKLLLTVQENILADDSQDPQTKDQLIEHYYKIREGIGVHKAPVLYGAFPTDPYSHTPAGKGAQQPGMTGQVKEDIISRWGELGIKVVESKITFDPKLFNSEEYLEEPGHFEFYDLAGNRKQRPIDKGELAFTYCQVPIIFSKGSDEKKGSISVIMKDKEELRIQNREIPADLSREVFSRSDKVMQIKVVF